MRNPHSAQPLPEIVNIGSNLTTMQFGSYVQLDFPLQSPGTRLVAEVMNLGSAPRFVGRYDDPWEYVVTFPSGVIAVSPLNAPRATTAGSAAPDDRELLMFVVEMRGWAKITSTAAMDVMTRAKRMVLQASGSWMDAVFGRRAPKVYKRMNYRYFARGMDDVMYPRWQSREDVHREMMVRAVESFYRDLLERRPLIGPWTRLEHALIDGIRHAKAQKRPPINFVGDLTQPDEEDEVEAVDAEIIRLAQKAQSGDAFDQRIADEDLVRRVCSVMPLTELERDILIDEFRDPGITEEELADKYGKTTRWIRWCRASITVKGRGAELEIRRMIERL